MTLNSQQYANLADHTYDRDSIGLRNLVGKDVVIEGITYKVLDHADKASGYQGTIYQRKDTGDIVVAHRGTEFGREALKDGVLADGGMVFARANMQSGDAIALTRHAMTLARRNDGDYQPKPEVTVTGHSLGGTLAQITAHHFDLRGETFNAYGAASLGYRIPEGGNRVLNHVMAADFVSAASPHYGQVRIHAMPAEITQLQLGGYHNLRAVDAVTRDNPLLASANGSHMMHNFLNVDGGGRRDVSMLGDPAAQALAARNAAMIDNFRGDVGDLRRAASLGGDGARIMRNGPVLAPLRAYETVRDALRPDLPPGEPERIEQREKASPDRRGSLHAPGQALHGARSASAMDERADPIAARFKDSLPGISDEKAAQLALQARMQAGITHPDQLAHIARRGDSVVAFSHVPGLRTEPMDLRQAPPPLQETREQSLAFEQQQQLRERDQPVLSQMRMA